MLHQAPYRPDTEKTVAEKYLVGAQQLLEGDVLHLNGQLQLPGLLDDLRARHPRHTATMQCRRRQPTVAHQENVAEDAFDHPSRHIPHQTFGKCRILPLRSGQNLLEAIEVFQAGKPGLLGQARSAGEQMHTLFGIFDRIGRRGGAEQHAPRRRSTGNGIAPLPFAAGDDQLGDAIAQGGTEGEDFRAQRRQVTGKAEALATILQALKMAFEQLRPSGADPDRLEQPITVGQTAIVDGQTRSGLAVHPAQFHSANRRNTSEPLVPPKPKEFEITASMAFGLACNATKSRSQPSSGSSRLMVGGATWSRMARMLKIASTAPAAPSRWPTMDLVELTDNS